MEPRGPVEERPRLTFLGSRGVLPCLQADLLLAMVSQEALGSEDGEPGVDSEEVLRRQPEEMLIPVSRHEFEDGCEGDWAYRVEGDPSQEPCRYVLGDRVTVLTEQRNDPTSKGVILSDASRSSAGRQPLRVV